MSNNIFDVITQRRSTRVFSNKTVSKDNLVKIAEAARMTPTSVNQQSRKFTIVQNEKLIKQLDQTLSGYGFSLYNPNAILLISSPKNYTYSQIETGLAVQNAYLAATALGLGTVWTDQIRGRCDEPAIRSILNKMGIPDNHICWCVLPIGVPDESSISKNRTEEINYIGPSAEESSDFNIS